MFETTRAAGCTHSPPAATHTIQLHFSNPKAYNDIYNNSNRWDKDAGLYHSFGEDRSSFGFLTYKEARQRKEVLNKSFSPAAVQSAAPLVLEKVGS